MMKPIVFIAAALALSAAPKPRARDLGVPFDGTPGALNAITDVRGRYPHVRFEAVLEETAMRGVRSRIARAVTNLLDNAGKWSPAGGVVEVTVNGGEVSVRDHGPGVAPEDAPRVFDRFWRASNARSLPGSGLGLSIVKDVAESHGGSVSVEHATGGGARFRLRLAGGS